MAGKQGVTNFSNLQKFGLEWFKKPNATPRQNASLRAAVAAYHGHGLSEENVLIGNGSDDILNLLVRVFGGPAAATGFTLPSYSLYPVLVAIQNGRVEPIEFDRSMQQIGRAHV